MSEEEREITMTEAMALKAKLQSQIAELLYEFSKATGLAVDTIYISEINKMYGGNDAKYIVDTEVKMR